jgi:VWFA-related protein
VISDGGDNASRRKFSDVIRKARESTATIYTIALFDPDSQENDIRALARLARQTGGEHFLLRFPAEVVPTCRQVAQDIRQRYTMAYVPDSTAKKGYRKIQVLASDASGHKLRVRARPGYVPRKSGVDSARINSGPEK